MDADADAGEGHGTASPRPRCIGFEDLLRLTQTQLAETPPHPKPPLRFGFDLSTHAGRGEAGYAATFSVGVRGSDTRTTVPLPSRERSFIEPPCRCASERAIARPRPEP
jgi:hypothetical protein